MKKESITSVPVSELTEEQAAKLRELDTAYKEYYDQASDEELAEQLAWAEGVSRNLWMFWDRAIDEDENC